MSLKKLSKLKIASVKFNEVETTKHDFKIRIISSNISIDRFYNNIDPIQGIEDLIKISSPPKNEK